jgi:uncharacterized protein
MVSLPLTSWLVVVAALSLVVLSFLVTRQRRRAQVSLWDGGDVALGRWMRAQGNYTEYTPMFLILVGLLELQQALPTALAVLAGAFVLGRLLHLIGMVRGRLPPRIAGMMLTFGPLAVGAIWLASMLAR